MARECAGIRRPFLFNGPFLSLLLCACAACGQPAAGPAVETPEPAAEHGGEPKAGGTSDPEAFLMFEVADLVALAGAATRADFLNLAYDRGELDYGENREEILGGDGIPDAAEVALLEMILKKGPLVAGDRGPEVYSLTLRAFQANTALAQEKLPEHAPGVHQAVAAVLTMGGWEHCPHAEWLAERISGRKTNLSDMNKSAVRYYGADDDLDGDGKENLEEWERAVEELGPDATPGELMARYVHLAGREQFKRE